MKTLLATVWWLTLVTGSPHHMNHTDIGAFHSPQECHRVGELFVQAIYQFEIHPDLVGFSCTPEKKEQE